MQVRVKVLRTFVDKHTGKLHKKGKEMEVSKERFEEINSTAHGVLVEPVTTVKKRVPKG